VNGILLTAAPARFAGRIAMNADAPLPHPDLIAAIPRLRRYARVLTGDASRADDLVRTDRRLNPDRRPDLYEAVVLGRSGRTREAIAVLERTVAAEPENLEAWALLAGAAKTEDPALAARARARQRELAPPVPDG